MFTPTTAGMQEPGAFTGSAIRVAVEPSFASVLFQVLKRKLVLEVRQLGMNGHPRSIWVLDAEALRAELQHLPLEVDSFGMINSIYKILS